LHAQKIDHQLQVCAVLTCQSFPIIIMHMVPPNNLPYITSVVSTNISGTIVKPI